MHVLFLQARMGAHNRYMNNTWQMDSPFRVLSIEPLWATVLIFHTLYLVFVSQPCGRSLQGIQQ